MSKAWGGVGAWALDAERAEAEEREHSSDEGLAHPGFPSLGEASAQSFPRLSEAARAKAKKKKKAISLSEFTTGAYVGPGGGARRDTLEPRGLTHDEMLRLPTGPRERSQEELQYGHGFRSYYGGGPTGGPREGASRRPYGGGGFDDKHWQGPPPRAAAEFDLPSRADEVDDWAGSKKSFGAGSMDSGRHNHHSALGVGGPSRADEVDNWAAGKKSLPSRYPSFGSGFRDSSASDLDGRVRGGGLTPHNGEQERPKLMLAPRKGEIEAPAAEPARTRPSPFGAARPREEVLAEKGLNWRKMETEIQLKKTASRPTSTQSSRPSSAQSSRPGTPGSQVGAGEVSLKPRQSVNPFGEAKPREVLLQDQGKDWRKIDMELEHRRVNRPETEEEKLSKDEIGHLKSVLAMETEGSSNGASAEVPTTPHEQILEKERDLEKLVHDLDDKVHFGQKATSDIRTGSGAGRMAMSSDRPPFQCGRLGSGAGTMAVSSDKPPSQSGRSEDSRLKDFTEGPQSHRAMGDPWAKPMDDGRGFQGSRERGSFGNRSMDRSMSRERW